MQEEAPLLVPDVLVCSVGTEIFFETAGEADKEWSAELDRGWDREGALAAAAAIPALKPQASGPAATIDQCTPTGPRQVGCPALGLFCDFDPAKLVQPNGTGFTSLHFQ